MFRRAFISAGALLIALVAQTANAQNGTEAPAATPPAAPVSQEEPRASYWVGGQLHAVFVSALLDWEELQLSGGVGITGGVHFRRAGLTLAVENSWFPEPTLAEDSGETFVGEMQGLVAVLVGVDLRYASEHLRLRISAGPTMLLRSSLVDRAGTVGIAFEARPAGIRIPLRGARTLVVDPLSFSMAIPDFSGIPLLLLQFRTTLSIEFDVTR